MEFSQADGLRSSEPVKNTYTNTIETPDDEWWDSCFRTGYYDLTEDEALPRPAEAALGSTLPLSYNRGYPLSSDPSSSPYFSEISTGYPTIQSPTGLRDTLDAQIAPHLDNSGDSLPSTALNIAASLDMFGAIGIESASHKLGPYYVTPPDDSHGINCALGKQSQLPFLPLETSDYDANFLFGHHEPAVASDALPVNRAECFTSDSPAKLYLYSAEENQRAQTQSAIDLDESDHVPFLPSLTSPAWQRGKQFKVLPASEPTPTNDSSPKDASLVSPYTASSPSDDIWKCDNCGTVLATKGAKNRNRNKRRHRCPGTGAKYPCSICPKSFNRGDTRLLHLRKRHPETPIEPPRRRKRTTLV